MLQIILLEDNLHYRRGLEQIIHDMSGVTLIGSYPNAEAVLKKIDLLKPDIFIVDINLEGMSGIEFIRRAKPFVPDAEFLMCTINDDNTNIFESLKSGATGYMLKESSADEIRNAIIEIAAGGSPMSAYISRRVIASFNADADKPPAPAAESLTDREVEVLNHLARGLQYKEIADRLDISTGTVKKHIRNTYIKLQVQNKVEAINKFRAI
ncbi:response regulator transcription factor [Mucilaginibacter rubeus]|uniref:Response regulator transcription factor n=2 Tax=Mucilaginibacter TaxID=423349 RepID=A0AAE6JH59_9SPHI|nr:MULTISPECIES: response regulator transcription factor [Mucilaginibacter]QEM05440.1 response regulator transcription factor [Mucilaginibacter rubeus]QEM18026.1 response regulator transcription factor [Mucilaginibacter gossypii]QTE37019.1 response regulator transcription factor [Mucilaginibacter gossypii]QTE45439.1 response regulator transcription factor [Mucilaginibacter rubeus]QTE52036.1 response regulator transcription factor [Mucilaginibacter rubeus]